MPGPLDSFNTFLGSLSSSVQSAQALGRSLGTLFEAVGKVVPSPAGPTVEQPAGAGVQGAWASVGTIDERVAIVTEYILAGYLYPPLIEHARQTVSRRCAQGAGGSTWCIPPHDKRGEINAIFAEVRENLVRYVSDPTGWDSFGQVRATLRMRAGDCANLVIVLGSMLGAIGYEIELVIIQEVGEPDWSHIFLRVAYRDPAGATQVVALDPSTPNPPGWEVSRDRVAVGPDGKPRIRSYRVPFGRRAA